MLDGLDAPQRAARTVLADVLDGKAEDHLFDAMLVAGELIANAIQHSSGAVLIRVEVYEFGAALGVVDRGADITAVPVRPSNSSVDEGTVAASGRGLFIVDSLASAWSVEETENGKIVRSARTASTALMDATLTAAFHSRCLRSFSSASRRRRSSSCRSRSLRSRCCSASRSSRSRRCSASRSSRARSCSSARALSARKTEPIWSSSGFLAVSAQSFFQPEA
ncbi:ATP-binding protein [Streptomyces sp. NPDC051644]|uniref:ATP-binding protein n=1 Tax=Streptomyces sp. NPDC051644 TaxID=3365666 RepID=UPI003799BF9E